MNLQKKDSNLNFEIHLHGTHIVFFEISKVLAYASHQSQELVIDYTSKYFSLLITRMMQLGSTL
ncbi:MAG TPA: hypothetical protein VJ697_06365 [Nitrososphaeraceae archaeon]|nr:hypothetical protein [Nitrososphaeraceae archaeon]